jgi:hypothetical protein
MYLCSSGSTYNDCAKPCKTFETSLNRFDTGDNTKYVCLVFFKEKRFFFQTVIFVDR